MGKRGPKPLSRAVGEYHIRLNDEHIKIIDHMGLGKTVDKILYLIIKEGERQQPNTKIQMLAKWERDRLEAKRLIALTYENRKRLLELGISPEYLDVAEENGDVPE